MAAIAAIADPTLVIDLMLILFIVPLGVVDVGGRRHTHAFRLLLFKARASLKLSKNRDFKVYRVRKTVTLNAGSRSN